MASKAKDMKVWAQLGASTRLAQLEAERARVLKAFPNLRRGTPTHLAEVRPKRRISAKARKAMKEGLRRYWAKRKAAERIRS